MTTKIIRLDDIRFAENEVDDAAIEKHVPTFRDYRNQWKEYNLAKKAGRNPKMPEFPCDTIRVYAIDDTYFPIDDNVSALLLAAERAKVNLVKVIVQEPIVNQDDLTLDNPPIHANRFFAEFKTALRQLQATDPQRVELFKPLLRAMLIEGFTDSFYRAKFMDWVPDELDRISPDKKKLNCTTLSTTAACCGTASHFSKGEFSMPTLTRICSCRLYLVAETPDAEGNYLLKVFELEDRNKEFAEDQTEKELRTTLDYLLGTGGSCHRIDDDMAFDENDNIQIDVGDGDSLSIPDIRDKIDVDPDKADYYVFVNQAYTEYRWIVCERQGTIYRDCAVADTVETPPVPTSLPPLPSADDLFEVDGYASDEEGNLYFDANGNKILTDDMYRKIEAQDWNA